MSREMFDGFGEEISEGNVLLINGEMHARISARYPVAKVWR